MNNLQLILKKLSKVIVIVKFLKNLIFSSILL